MGRVVAECLRISLRCGGELAKWTYSYWRKVRRRMDTRRSLGCRCICCWSLALRNLSLRRWDVWLLSVYGSVSVVGGNKRNGHTATPTGAPETVVARMNAKVLAAMKNCKVVRVNSH